MKYYLRHSSQPRGRAELHVVIKTGSVQEAEHERGIAHLIEHLAFRATTSLSSEFQLVKELESHGIRFGAHQNAYTSFEETVFELHVPLDKEDLLEKSLHMLQQLALCVRCSDEDVERERGIVVEEWRTSRTAGRRSGESQLDQLLQGSLYPERLPIGLMEVINNIPPSNIRDFYTENYHPGLMAVVAVGDFSFPIEDMIPKLEAAFGPSQRDTPPPVREPIVVPTHDDIRVSIFEDRECTACSFSMLIKQPRLLIVTVKDYRQTILEDIFHQALSARLSKVALQTHPPFHSASSSTINPVPSITTIGIEVSCKAGGVMKAMEAVLVEVARVKQHGFEEKEIALIKKNFLHDYLADIKSLWIERDKTESIDLCDELKDHFLLDVPCPGIVWEAQVYPTLAEGITVEEVNAEAGSYCWGKQTVIHVNKPKANTLAFWSASAANDDIRSEDVVKLVKQFCDEDYVGQGQVPSGEGTGAEAGQAAGGEGQVTGKKLERQYSQFKHLSNGGLDDLANLLPENMEQGEVVSTKYYEGINSTEVTFGNGLQVTIRPSDFFDDEVLYTAQAHGGLTELPEDDYPSGKMAVRIAEQFGEFDVHPSLLGDLLSGKRLTLATSIDQYDRTISGECGRDDLEASLQLMHRLFISRPQWDDQRLQNVMDSVKESIMSSVKDPRTRYSYVLDHTNTKGHYFFAPPDLKLLKKVNARFAVDFFSTLFSDPASFRVFLVGSVDLDVAVPLLTKYLGSIPRKKSPTDTPTSEGKGQSEGISSAPPTLSSNQVVPLEVGFPEGVTRKTVKLSMVEEGACSTMTFPITLGGAKHPTHLQRLDDSHMLSFCCKLFERHLVEVLRFKKSSIYSVSVSESYVTAKPILKEDDPMPVLVFVNFTCDPADVKLLQARVVEELRILQSEGPTDEEIRAVVESDKREMEVSQRTNAHWLSMLIPQYSSPRYSGNIEVTVGEWLESKMRLHETMSKQAMQEAFQHFFGDRNRRTEVSLVPRNWRGWHMAAFALGLAGAGLLVARAKKR
ncbi:unnamed protein product [Chrysoparadoxa australica]